MRERLLPPMAGTFASLAILTILSWLVFEEAAAPGLAASAVILIASLKIRLVFTRFMELHWPVRPWRLVFEVWMGVVTLLLLGGYWYAAGVGGG